MDREQMTALGVGDMEGLSKQEKKERTHGHGQQAGDCWGEVEEGIGRITGNGKYTIK